MLKQNARNALVNFGSASLLFALTTPICAMCRTKQQQMHLVMDAGFVRTTFLCLCMEVAVLFAAYSHPPVRFWAMDTYEEIKLKMIGAAHLTFVCVSFVYCVCVVCVSCVSHVCVCLCARCVCV